MSVTGKTAAMQDEMRMPVLGINPRRGNKPRILVLERIRPNEVEMVYINLYWWQHMGVFDVSVLNVWPIDLFNGLPGDLDFNEFDAVVIFPRLGYDPLALFSLDHSVPTKFKEYSGVKVLFRQDENHLTSTITDFINKHEFDLFFTCVPTGQIHRAYPDIDSRTQIVSVLTGYVEPIQRQREFTPFVERDIDLFYRAYLGRLAGGQLIWDKYRIGVVAKQKLENRNGIDISLDPEDRLYGLDWSNRLNRSRAVLGTESGSNVFDFEGIVSRWASEFAEQPEWSDFEACEDYYHRAKQDQLAQFEGNVHYAQVSPRHFEAAAHGCVQIMFPGTYSGIFQKDRHYLELKKDFSNFDECFEKAMDANYWRELTNNSFEEIILNPKYSIENFINCIENQVGDALQKKPKLKKAQTSISNNEKNTSSPSNKYTDTLAEVARLYGKTSLRYAVLLRRATHALREADQPDIALALVDDAILACNDETNPMFETNTHTKIMLVYYVWKNINDLSITSLTRTIDSFKDGNIKVGDVGLLNYWRLVSALYKMSQYKLASELMLQLINNADPKIRKEIKYHRSGMILSFDYLCAKWDYETGSKLASAIVKFHEIHSHDPELIIPRRIFKMIEVLAKGKFSKLPLFILTRLIFIKIALRFR
ncbi:MAG: hypothetical protein AAGE61_04375 [Pseudomonadota bacterium]